MNDTKIEWTDRTWNPTSGCDVCSRGCANCYAMRMAGRFSGPGKPYNGLVTIGKNKRAVWNGEVRFHPERLRAPLGWREPSKVFVDSMSDLFFEEFTNEQIAAVFGIMAAAPRHTFQILTKRSKRMRAWFQWVAKQRTGLITIPYSPRLTCRVEASRVLEAAGLNDNLGTESQPRQWPLPNVWLGVSVEDQEAAEERIDDLLMTPAAVRFLSCEPLLGPVDLLRWLDPTGACCGTSELQCSGCPSNAPWRHTVTREDDTDEDPPTDPTIDWVIVGAESGPGARECEASWISEILERCTEHGVRRFVKQAVLSSPPADVGEWEGVREGAGSHRHGRGHGGPMIGAPYIDGHQYLEFPGDAPERPLFPDDNGQGEAVSP